MGRMYTLTFQAQSITTANGDYDLFEIDPADDKPVALHWLHLGQITELGDAAEEQLRISVVRGHTSTGNGTSTTPRPLIHADTASGATCETVGSTIASAGTAVTLCEHVWNVRSPLDIIWTPETRPTCADTEGLIVVRLMSTVADDITSGLSGTLYFEELV